MIRAIRASSVGGGKLRKRQNRACLGSPSFWASPSSCFRTGASLHLLSFHPFVSTLRIPIVLDGRVQRIFTYSNGNVIHAPHCDRRRNIQVSVISTVEEPSDDKVPGDHDADPRPLLQNDCGQTLGISCDQMSPRSTWLNTQLLASYCRTWLQ